MKMVLEEGGKTWEDYLKMTAEERKAEDKKSQELDMVMLFI